MRKKYTYVIPLFCFLSACSTIQSGELPVSERLNNLKKGDSIDKIYRLLGPPAFEEKQGTPFMIYARNKKKTRGFLPCIEVERDIYVLTFNDKGALLEKIHLTLNEANKVSFDPDLTKTQHIDPSLLEELMSNFGRYDSGHYDSINRY